VFSSGPQLYMWYVEVLGKTYAPKEMPLGATKQVSEPAILRIGLFTTPSTLINIGIIMVTEQIFFLHGLESSSKGTKARFFAHHFPEVISPDFNGDLSERLRQLERICLGTTDLIFIGSSFGGLMATCFATKYPERVARLILMVPALNFGNYRAPKVKLSIPTLLIAGQHDTITPPAQIIPLAKETFSNLEIHIEDDDHMLHNCFEQLNWNSLLN